MSREATVAAFRAYDFDASAEWKEYLNRVEITSTTYNAMLKLKLKWFHNNQDQSLDVALAFEACRGASNAGFVNLEDVQGSARRAGTQRAGNNASPCSGGTTGDSSDEGVIQAIAQHKLEGWLQANMGHASGPPFYRVLTVLLNKRVKAADAEYAAEVLVKAGLDPNQHLADAPKGPLSPSTMGQMALLRPALLKKVVGLGLQVNQRQVNTGGTLVDFVVKLCALGAPQPPGGTVGVPILLKSLQVLLDAGANPDLPDDLGHPPLNFALQDASRAGQVELVRALYAVSDTSEFLNAAVEDVCGDLKRSMGQLVGELKAIAKDLPASGADDPTSKSPAVRRAASILLGSHIKVRKWDDLLDLSPTFHLPQLTHLIGQLACFLALSSAPLPDAMRMYQMPQAMPSTAQLPAKTVKRFVALFLASPHHPGYQTLMQWCIPLRGAVVGVRALLPHLPKGLRTYVEWLKLHKRPKDQPCFQSADRICRVVSWVIMCNDLPQDGAVQSHPQYFEDLVRFGHHRDLADLAEMGCSPAVLQWGTICYDMQVRLETLLELPSRPKFLKALESPVRKVVKEASSTGEVDLKTNQLCRQSILAMAYIVGAVLGGTTGVQQKKLWAAVLEVCKHPLWGAITDYAALGELPPKVVAWARQNPANMPVLGDMRSTHVAATRLVVAVNVPYKPPPPAAPAPAAANISPSGSAAAAAGPAATAASLASAMQRVGQLPAVESMEQDPPEWLEMIDELKQQAASQGMAFKDFLDKAGFRDKETGTVGMSEGVREHDMRRHLKDLMKNDKVCWNCGDRKAKSGKALLVCGRCKKGRYCSGDCQKAHWKNGHKAFCSATQDLRPGFVAG